MSDGRLIHCSAAGLVGVGLNGESYRYPVVPAASTSRRLGHKTVVSSSLMERARVPSLAVLLH